MAHPLKQQAKVRTNPVKDSTCSVTVPAVKFSDLWKSYPSEQPYVDKKTGKAPHGYENQCAIKVSWAIHGVGVQMKSFNGAAVSVDGKRLSVRAEELARWLKKQPFCGLPSVPAVVTGAEWAKTIKGKTGIVFFANYWQRDGERSRATGDHIDLWNGTRLTASGLMGSVQSFLRFTANIGSISGLYSDLGKSTEILFWEVK